MLDFVRVVAVARAVARRRQLTSVAFFARGAQRERAVRSHPELEVVLADLFATELFGSARAAVGKRVKVNGVVMTVIGVAPPRFNGAVQSGQRRRLWLPLSTWPVLSGVDATLFDDPNAKHFEAVARLQPGGCRSDDCVASGVVGIGAHERLSVFSFLRRRYWIRQRSRATTRGSR